MLNEINGLPSHILLVHAVVVLLPIAALLAIIGAVRPAARRRLGIVTPLLAMVAVLLIPLTTNAGEWLQSRVTNTALVRKHVQLGDSLLPWAGALLVLVTGLWLLERRELAGRPVPPALTARWVGPVSGVLTVLVALVALVQVYRVGDSGAKASWDGRYAQSGSVETGAGAGSP